MAQIKLEYGTEYVNSYVFLHNPSSVDAVLEMETDRYRQSDASRVSYERGRKWRFRLFWNVIPQDMVNVLRAIREYPEPYRLTLTDIYPNGTYIVNWENDLEFSYLFSSTDAEMTGEMELAEV